MISRKTYTFPNKETVTDFLLSVYADVEEPVHLIYVKVGNQEPEPSTVKLFQAIYGTELKPTSQVVYEVTLEFEKEQTIKALAALYEDAMYYYS